uniref:Uncharacterized protein n=1 Tax=Aegilops tauschii subsp. strangulata TaxID=200361 RepID=A0A453KN84_AEGTS
SKDPAVRLSCAVTPSTGPRRRHRQTRRSAMDREALRMVCSPQFWRMGVLWTLSLLYSYLLLFLRGRTAAPRRREDVRRGGRPICVVTG